jgi:hypothetical protein
MNELFVAVAVTLYFLHLNRPEVEVYDVIVTMARPSANCAFMELASLIHSALL